MDFKPAFQNTIADMGNTHRHEAGGGEDQGASLEMRGLVVDVKGLCNTASISGITPVLVNGSG